MKRMIAKGLWQIDTFMLVSFKPSKTQKETGHTRTVGTWLDMQNKMVGYTLNDCVAVAKGRRERGDWPFPHNSFYFKLRRNDMRRAARAAKKLQSMTGFDREAKNRNAVCA